MKMNQVLVLIQISNGCEKGSKERDKVGKGETDEGRTDRERIDRKI